MGENKQVILTYEGVKKVEDELEYLKTVKRKEVTQKIKTALSFGDLSENSEYDEAKNEQAFVEGRIATLENMLKNAKIIDDDDIKTDVVSVGAVIKVKDLDYGDEMEFTIVGSAEADPSKMKISNEAPIGRGLLGKKVGEKVEIQVPDGKCTYEVIEIRRNKMR
jgi:transcription elongation factor GreA